MLQGDPGKQGDPGRDVSLFFGLIDLEFSINKIECFILSKLTEQNVNILYWTPF